MTTEVLIKGFFALIFSGMFAWMVFDRDSDSNMDSNRGSIPNWDMVLSQLQLMFQDRLTA